MFLSYCTSNTFFYDSDNVLWCHGKQNFSHNLGLRGTSYVIEPCKVNCPDASTVIDVAQGSAFTILLDDNGILWGSGRYLHGKKSSTFTKIEGLPFIEQIASTYSRTLVLDSSNKLWELRSNIPTPRKPRKSLLSSFINLFRNTSNDNDGMDNANPIKQIDNLPDIDIRKIACSNSDSFAEDFEGNIWHWTDSQEPIQIQSNHEKGPLRSLTVNEYYCIIVDSIGDVWVHGFRFSGYTNEKDFFTKETRVPEIRYVVLGFYFIAALDKNGGVWVWGVPSDLSYVPQFNPPYRNFDEIAVPMLYPDVPKAKEIVAGMYRCMGIAEDNKCYVVGVSGFGKDIPTNPYNPYNIHLVEYPLEPLIINNTKQHKSARSVIS